MRPLIIPFLIISVGSSALAMDKGPGINHNCIRVVSMADDTFSFKSDKDVAGATVDVYSYKTGAKVLTTVVDGKYTSVNLKDQETGDYIILITKGKFKRKYVFHKTIASEETVIARCAR